MRIRTLLCLAALTAGVATTMAQSNVYSLNIVGYVTKTNVSGYQLISNPLNATNNSIASLYADSPSFTRVYRFVGGAYQQYVNDPDDGWTGPGGPGDVFSLNPGEGVFLLLGGTYTKTYVGEVVLNSTNPIPAGFSIRASALPQAGLVQTELGYPAANFDRVYKWAGTAYVQYVLDPDDGWVGPGGPGQEPSLNVGESAFIQTAAAKNWIRNFSVGP